MPPSGTEFQELQVFQDEQVPIPTPPLFEPRKMSWWTLHFLVYRWPYLCHMGPEGLSAGQTTGAAWLGLGFWPMGGTPMGSLKPCPLSTDPRGTPTCEGSPPGSSLSTLRPAGLSTLGMCVWQEGRLEGGTDGIPPEARWTSGKASLGRTRTPNSCRASPPVSLQTEEGSECADRTGCRHSQV